MLEIEMKMMKKSKLNQSVRIGTALVAVLAFAGCGKKQEQVDCHRRPVSSVTVKAEQVLLYSELPGRVPIFDRRDSSPSQRLISATFTEAPKSEGCPLSIDPFLPAV